MKKIIFAIAATLITVAAAAQVTPENDTLFLQQKTLFKQMNVLEAWETTKGSSEVVIGVVDNGFDFYHPYLHERVEPGYWEPCVYHSETFQEIGHGTAVAGILVANPLTPNGVHGLSPDCRVLTASMGMIEHPFERSAVELQRANQGLSKIDAIKEVFKDTVDALQFGSRWREYMTNSMAR